MGGLGGGYGSSDDDECGFGGYGPFSGADVEELLCQVGCRGLAALLEGCSSAWWWAGGCAPTRSASFCGHLPQLPCFQSLHFFLQGVKPWDDDAADVLAVLNGDFDDYGYY